LIAGRCPFNPVDATLAPGPKTPPARSDRRVGVNGSVRPPGGPDKNRAIAVQILIEDNKKVYQACLDQLRHHTTRQRARNLRQPQFLSSIDTRVPSAKPYLRHGQRTCSIAGPLLGRLLRRSGNQLHERRQGILARLHFL
jgi:hypothetical protein